MAEIWNHIDWTPILTAIIALILTGLSRIVMTYVVPWLKQHNLATAAAIAVRAAEAVYGRYKGEEKMKAAISMVVEKGIHVSEKEIIDAVKAAWAELNLQMIEAGIKDTEEET